MAVTILIGIKSLHPVCLVFEVVLVVILLKVLLASNTVTGIIIIPILITLAQRYEMLPWILVGPAAFTSSLGVILVTQTPTNVIPYTCGFFTLRDFAKSGLMMSFLMSISITGTIALFGPLTGMYTY